MFVKSEKYCCEKFQKVVESPEEVFNRKTTFKKIDGIWYTDFSDGEYGEIELIYCPFCGTKLGGKQ